MGEAVSTKVKWYWEWFLNKFCEEIIRIGFLFQSAFWLSWEGLQLLLTVSFTVCHQWLSYPQPSCATTPLGITAPCTYFQTGFVHEYLPHCTKCISYSNLGPLFNFFITIVGQDVKDCKKSSGKPDSVYDLQRPGCFSYLTQKVKLWEKYYLAEATIFVETYPPILGFHVSGTFRLLLTASVLSKCPAAVLSLKRG